MEDRLEFRHAPLGADGWGAQKLVSGGGSKEQTGTEEVAANCCVAPEIGVSTKLSCGGLDGSGTASPWKSRPTVCALGEPPAKLKLAGAGGSVVGFPLMVSWRLKVIPGARIAADGTTEIDMVRFT
jgi:hypothetical protein